MFDMGLIVTGKGEKREKGMKRVKGNLFDYSVRDTVPLFLLIPFTPLLPSYNVFLNPLHHIETLAYPYALRIKIERPTEE